jgi:hypothetical protein
MNELGITVLRFSHEQILGYGECIMAIEFYIGEYENTLRPSQEELEQETSFIIQNYLYKSV